MKKLFAALLSTAIAVGSLPLFRPALAAEDTRVLPVLMYHSILKSRKSDYIVSPETFEADIRYLSSRGYRSVTAEELIRYADGTGDLPEKPVLVTFDDGHYNNMYYGFPILEKYGWHAVINVIGKFSKFSTDSGDSANPNYSHLTWEEMRELEESGLVEIGNHTYNMHDYSPRFGVRKKAGESDEDYLTALYRDFGTLQEILYRESGITPRVFAYPFGAYNDITQFVLGDMGFRVILTCSEKANLIRKGCPETLLSLGRFNRNPAYSQYDLAVKLEKSAKKLQQ